jgi:hypothetical protein
MRKTRALTALTLATALGAIALIPGSDAIAQSDAAHGDAIAATRVAAIDGRVVTGFNSYLGQPVVNYAPPVGTLSFEMLAEFNVFGGAPIPLRADTAKSKLLATFVSPAVLQAMGLTPDDVNPASINLPLRQVAPNLTADGLTRGSVPGLAMAQQVQVSQAEPSYPITLAEWERAGGSAKIVCGDDGASIELTLASLIPNRLYTAWAVFGGTAITGIPLGGLPNVVVTDEWGDATLRRRLNFCPIDLKPGERPLLAIEVVLHGDHQSYGAVPDLGLAGRELSLFAGTIRWAHLDFPITTQE